MKEELSPESIADAKRASSAVETIVMCPLCKNRCDFDEHENGYVWAGCVNCQTYASAFTLKELKNRLYQRVQGRLLRT